MSAEQGYNGWSNYETWLVNLWIGNDEASHCYWESEARECLEVAHPASAAFTREERAALLLADLMKEEIEGAAPIDGANMYVDLLRAALSEVNYNEIARHFIENCGA